MLLLHLSQALSFIYLANSSFLSLATGWPSRAILPQEAISLYRPYTLFAGVAYCQPARVANWTCGANCAALPEFIPTATGGDGDLVQYWYVGYYPPLDTIIISHEGLQVAQLLADITVLSFPLINLNQTLFPGTNGLQVHAGFAGEQAKTAHAVLEAVKEALTTYMTTHITIAGHSLGAAIGILDATFLSLQLPKSVSFKFIGYGMPRVGDPAFAAYLDDHFPDSELIRINNKEDFIPIVPGKFMGFEHPHGEIHIDVDGQWNICPGDDNSSPYCSSGDVANVIVGEVKDHDGPYDGIMISCK